MTTNLPFSRAVLALPLLAAAALGACGGSDPDPQSTAHPIAVNQLFIEDPHSGEIAAFPTASPQSGTAFASHVVASLNGASGAMAYDSVHDELYVAASATATDTASIRVYSNASTMTTGTPTRTITFVPGIPAFSLVTTLSIDTATDTLWVYGRNGSDLIPIPAGTLLTVAHASTASGQVADGSTVGVMAAGTTTSFAYDAGRDTAYVTGTIDSQGTPIGGVSVYPAASATFATSGLQSPSRNIGIAGAVNVALDASRDILYVADAQRGLWIVQQASSAAPILVGPVAMARTNFVAVDPANDRLVVGAGTNAYVFENASTLGAGAVFPAPSVVGSGSDTLSSAAFH